jgi:hypothetical protein
MLQPIDRGFAINPAASSRLQDWESLFEEWILAIERYCRLVPDKAPYWYTERANVGLLAGAAWRSGWIALEEFQANRTEDNVGWRGRLDLWLRSASAAYVIEAKLEWVSLTSHLVEPGINSLDEACSDVLNLVLTEDQTRVGIAFCVPYIKRNLASQVDQKVGDLLDLLNRVNHDAIAWCFPSCTRALLDRKQEEVYPGIILLARIVRKEDSNEAALAEIEGKEAD